MSDFSFVTQVSRGQIIDELRDDDEHLVYVISGALANRDLDIAFETSELHQMSYGQDRAENLVGNLRRLADAIEKGEIT